MDSRIVRTLYTADHLSCIKRNLVSCRLDKQALLKKFLALLLNQRLLLPTAHMRTACHEFREEASAD